MRSGKRLQPSLKVPCHRQNPNLHSLTFEAVKPNSMFTSVEPHKGQISWTAFYLQKIHVKPWSQSQYQSQSPSITGHMANLGSIHMVSQVPPGITPKRCWMWPKNNEKEISMWPASASGPLLLALQKHWCLTFLEWGMTLTVGLANIHFLTQMQEKETMRKDK